MNADRPNTPRSLFASGVVRTRFGVSLCPVRTRFGVSLCVALVSLSLGSPVWSFDLEGDWYVLVHYEDHAAESLPSDSLEPDARFEDTAAAVDRGIDYRDFVWRFEPRHGDLRWTVFPGVRFRDETGRYEMVRGTRARLRHAWRPSRAQLEEIRAGLSVDEKTARSKTLRRQGAGARDSDAHWASGAAARASSASAVAYGEHWELDVADGRPVFALRASLESGRADGLDGMTRFTGETVNFEGGRIEGEYLRDGEERGRFVMWRKGPGQALDTGDAAESGVDSLLGPGGAARSSVVALQAMIARGRSPEGRDDPQLRGEIRAALLGMVEEAFTRRGDALRSHRSEIDALADEIERLVVVEGVALEEVDRRFGAGELGS